MNVYELIQALTALDGRWGADTTVTITTAAHTLQVDKVQLDRNGQITITAN